MTDLIVLLRCDASATLTYRADMSRSRLAIVAWYSITFTNLKRNPSCFVGSQKQEEGHFASRYHIKLSDMIGTLQIHKRNGSEHNCFRHTELVGQHTYITMILVSIEGIHELKLFQTQLFHLRRTNHACIQMPNSVQIQGSKFIRGYQTLFFPIFVFGCFRERRQRIEDPVPQIDKFSIPQLRNEIILFTSCRKVVECSRFRTNCYTV